MWIKQVFLRAVASVTVVCTYVCMYLCNYVFMYVMYLPDDIDVKLRGLLSPRAVDILTCALRDQISLRSTSCPYVLLCASVVLAISNPTMAGGNNMSNVWCQRYVAGQTI